MGLTKQSQTFASRITMSTQNPHHKDCSTTNSSVPARRPKSTEAIGGDDGARNLLGRRLTRQRKLRYLSDHELGISRLNERSRSTPASPESAADSPPGTGYRDHWSFSAVPQPLPLPIPADFFSRRKYIEQAAINTSKNSTKQCQTKKLPQDTQIRNGRTISVCPVSPIRSNAGDIILCSGAQHEADFCFDLRCSALTEPQEERDGFPNYKSAPTSPVASPRRAVGPGNAVRGGAGAGAGGNKTKKAVLKKSLSEDSGGHPLPLPPGAVSLSPCLSPVKGQWKKGKLIGRGTFGSVYLGTNSETGALCAMKEVDLIPDDPKSVECIRQLEQEIRVLRQLKHPNIVQYYGSEVVDDHFYIYLEYVYPGSINKYVREHCGAINESVVRNFTRHILNGLVYLHSTKTIHRDIKGANLLVDSSGVVKLADFGMAKHLTGQSYDLSLRGSPYWMAPEVIKAAMHKTGSPYLALAIDIWSLGCTIIEMMSGRPPWGEFTGPQAMFKVLNGAPPIPETLSSEGKDFLNCCFRRNPVDRPSASKLLEHAFVRNLHNQNVSPTAHGSYATTIMDKLHTKRSRRKDKFDFMTMCPIERVGIPNGSPPYNGNTSSPWTLSL